MIPEKAFERLLGLDEWSRKAIQWRVAWQQTAEESRLLLEGGLIE